MKKLLGALLCFGLAALPLFAGDEGNGNGNSAPDTNPYAAGSHLRSVPSNDKVHNDATPGGSGPLRDHGGQVLTNAKVVYVFWGWSSNTTDPYITQVLAFRNSSAGMVSHLGMLSQYRSAGSTNLVGSQADVYDAVPPSSTKVTDVMVQQEVAKYFGSSFNASTVYEVLIPSGYYSDDGTGAQSCGGTNLQYCAYHGNGDGTHLNANAKYSIQPYPSCSGCHGLASWTAAQDEEHFIVHETREAFTDAQGSAWYDRAGYEADDKCAWGTNLAFLFTETTSAGTFAYQMEYSNSARNCVK